MTNETAAAFGPILLVDDDETLVSATARRIRLALPEVTVEAFADGTTALRATAGRPLGLALLDVDMPIIDGFELCAALHRRQPELPVAFLTGSSPKHTSEVGAIAWLQKPVTTEQLLLTIRAYALRSS